MGRLPLGARVEGAQPAGARASTHAEGLEGRAWGGQGQGRRSIGAMRERSCGGFATLQGGAARAACGSLHGRRAHACTPRCRSQPPLLLALLHPGACPRRLPWVLSASAPPSHIYLPSHLPIPAFLTSPALNPHRTLCLAACGVPGSPTPPPPSGCSLWPGTPNRGAPTKPRRWLPGGGERSLRGTEGMGTRVGGGCACGPGAWAQQRAPPPCVVGRQGRSCLPHAAALSLYTRVSLDDSVIVAMRAGFHAPRSDRGCCSRATPCVRHGCLC